MRVGIFGSEEDHQVRTVMTEAARLGASVVTLRLDHSEMGTWKWSKDGITRPDGSRLDDLRSIYVRSVPSYPPHHGRSVVRVEEQEDWLERAEAGRRALGTARSAQRSLADRGVMMVNPVESFWFHRSKPGADLRLAAAGLPVARGLVTTDAESLRSFVDEVGDVVYKPVAGGGECRLLSDPRDVARGSLRLAPVLFQERIRGRDLRIYVVGGIVVGACVIHTDAIDYRGNETGLERIEVGADLDAMSLRSADALGMVFTGVDIKEADDGTLTVLDVNPSPMFAGIDQATGLGVAAALARFLVGGAE